MMLNAQALLKNEELFEDVMTQYCQVMECSRCSFKQHNIACNHNADGYHILWRIWAQKEVKPFE